MNADALSVRAQWGYLYMRCNPLIISDMRGVDTSLEVRAIRSMGVAGAISDLVGRDRMSQLSEGAGTRLEHRSEEAHHRLCHTCLPTASLPFLGSEQTTTLLVSLE